MLMQSQLVGKKVTLRKPETTDLELILDWENNEEIWSVSGTTKPYTREQITLYLKTLLHDLYSEQQLRFIINENESHRAVGCIDLFGYEPEQESASVGILIANKSDRKKGYAADALQILIHFSSQNLNLRKLYACIDKRNHDSLNLFQSAVFINSDPSDTKAALHCKTLSEKNILLKRILNTI